jgi:hypothetical protein
MAFPGFRWGSGMAGLWRMDPRSIGPNRLDHPPIVRVGVLKQRRYGPDRGFVLTQLAVAIANDVITSSDRAIF